VEVKVAKSAGFCFGVKRAVEQVYKQIELNADSKHIYTFGPIIHNEEVVNDLAKKGVQVIETKDDLLKIKDGVIIIRSHGVEKEIYDIIEKQGLTLVDATCPFVRKIHKIVQEEKEKGRHIVITGNPGHPEVQGIMSWAGEDFTVLSTEEEAENFTLPEGKQACIVSQTTFNYNKFKYLVEIISKKGYDIVVLDTICNATHERQAEAKDIAKEVEAMIVIGGKHSSNTQKLYEICKKECNNTYYIQTLKDLDFSELKDFRYVGITAGASTPNNIIEEVQANVRTEF
jgi:4-hydroxy-3-methylbut-2-enyl diphosphate reductase